MSSRPAIIQWNEVTALFGGTFDPPHLGHRFAIAGLFSNPGVAKVRVIPSPSPAYKPTVASAEDRVAMAKLGFGPDFKLPIPGHVEIELCELERSRLRPNSPTYSFETLSDLKREIPRMAFAIGSDQLVKLPTWHRFPEVLSLCHWIVLERNQRGERGSTAPKTGNILSEWEASGLIKAEGAGWRISPALGNTVGGVTGGSFLQVFPTPAQEMSSTQIRESLARTGRPPDSALMPEVEAYLMQRDIYGIGKPQTQL